MYSSHMCGITETSLTWADIFEGSDGLFLALGEALHTEGDHLSPVGAYRDVRARPQAAHPASRRLLLWWA